MKTNLHQVALRQNAIWIPSTLPAAPQKEITPTTSTLAANAARLGFTFSESLLHALNEMTPAFKLELLEALKTVTGIYKSWTPLVKGWDTPTGETRADHLVTYFANMFKAKGTAMPCGHVIPSNTFPLERYNGCPFCGTPFIFGEIEDYGQGSKLKVLELWQDKELQDFYKDLLTSKTPLDATQADSLKLLLQALPAPEVAIGMKETLMLVIDTLKTKGAVDEAGRYFTSPTDILRYLWYQKTGFLQLVEPGTLIKRNSRNHAHIHPSLNRSGVGAAQQRHDLRLKYSRKDCQIVAKWLNDLAIPAEKACELMHPKRGMWVRFIRALRLPEYARKVGFERLRTLLDVFYNQTYEVWQGRVEQVRIKYDAATAFALLQQRPGLFARSLFANMLWFGAEDTLNAFRQVIDQVPARLVFTLNMYAGNYFNPGIARSVKPLGGTHKTVPANQLLKLYEPEELSAMQASIEDLCLDAMKARFAKMSPAGKTMFIDPLLYHMPVAIGDRSDTVQDLPAALMGTRFPLEGDTVRLFMQWGQGLPAQHLDMDLSCHIAYATGSDICSYSRLVTTGCKHSGDIRSIPNKIGTAEYIDIDVRELAAAGAQYVTFTCNAYSNGSISPNLVVGWMDSKHPMKISERSGVAYDPSCVQHQVRVTQSVAKGLVFGVLDVTAREIIWLEMTFSGQMVQNLDRKGVTALLAKLNNKLSVGALLQLKAGAQGMTLVEHLPADEVYDQQWARNTAAVTQLLID
ncbi:hypothetical protein [Taibaiella koreensis]|uniref:hypothetical protein n=1 Tax=Taibaiella koreensis TaxID=1268548 RepID=UPI000E5A0CFA|nr:hypothetical protein [Taibaiella koreensis]